MLIRRLNNIMTKNSLTSEISAIQIKLHFLHFKSLKINEEIKRIRAQVFPDNTSPESIKTKGEYSFCTIDLIALFEGYHSLANNIFNNKYISENLDDTLRAKLENVKEVSGKWKLVRNKIGGHLDFNIIKSFCEKYNYRGVFITDFLEADFKGVILLQIIESAINNTLLKSQLFSDQLTLTTIEGLETFLTKINSDWNACFMIYRDLDFLLYRLGKADKLKVIGHNNIGIVKFRKRKP